MTDGALGLWAHYRFWMQEGARAVMERMERGCIADAVSLSADTNRHLTEWCRRE